MSITEHAEKFLGPIADGFSLRTPLQTVVIARFAGRPHPFASTYVTLGLSEKILSQRSGRKLRQELVFSCEATYDPEAIYRLLGTVVYDVLKSDGPFARGQVLGPAGPLLDGATVSAFFCMPPMFLPSEFALYNGVEPPAMFVWLVPITEAEARLAAKLSTGFEEQLDAWQEKENILDLKRAGMPG